MKIGSQTNIINSIDFVELISELESKYRSIYWTSFEGDLYIYKPLGRRDFRLIISDENLSIEDKVDKIIQTSIVYPEDFNIDDCLAGLVNVLYEKIMEISYLDSEKSRAAVIDYFRQDMYSLDNQITCLINEAFPNFDIEEIENWDIERTAKFLSRAEYKLKNFRGFDFNEEYFQGTTGVLDEEEKEDESQEETPVAPSENNEKNKKQKMTPERLRQLQAQFPEINWADDAVLNGGVNAMNEVVDTTPPALRPGFF